MNNNYSLEENCQQRKIKMSSQTERPSLFLEQSINKLKKSKKVLETHADNQKQEKLLPLSLSTLFFKRLKNRISDFDFSKFCFFPAQKSFPGRSFRFQPIPSLLAKALIDKKQFLFGRGLNSVLTVEGSEEGG